MMDIADHAGLRCPKFDERQDALWLEHGQETSGSRLRPQPAEAWSRIRISEVSKLVAAVDHDTKSAIERILLSLEASFDDKYLLTEHVGTTLIDKVSWTEHIQNRIRDLHLESPDELGVSLKERLDTLVMSEQWSFPSLLIKLDEYLPAGLPVVVREFLWLGFADGYTFFGWRLQQELARVLAFHNTPLVLRAFGTVVAEHVDPGSSICVGLLDGARTMFSDEADYERWFNYMTGLTVGAYAERKRDNDVKIDAMLRDMRST